MFDIGWPEFAVILIVALIVIGPKDLPRALHTVGKWVRKARMLAREFQGSIDDMVRQAELEDLKKQVEQARSFNIKDQLEKAVDPDGGVREALTIEDSLEEIEISRPVPEPAKPVPVATAAQGAGPLPPGPAPSPAGGADVTPGPGGSGAASAAPASVTADEKRG